MHFLILFLAAAAMAFHIPEGTADGVYQVSYNADGTENHTRIDNIETKKPTFAIRGATLEKRTYSVNCDPQEAVLNTNDNGAAATELANQCGTSATVGGRLNYYSIVGCSVAYFCNFKNHGQVCTSQNAWNSFNIINGVCGYDTPGWIQYNDSDGSDRYGYEWVCTSPGRNFCNN